MNNREKNLLKNAINARLARLQFILDSHVSGREHEHGSGADESARLDELNVKEVDETLIHIAKLEKSQLLKNLEWLETEDAGICIECEREIPFQRLMSIPTTRYCVDCANSL